MDATRRLIDRAARDPYFLAYHLGARRLRTGEGDAGLCRVLGCGEEALLHLSLCPAPAPGDAGRREELELKFALREGSLAGVLALR